MKRMICGFMAVIFLLSCPAVSADMVTAGNRFARISYELTDEGILETTIVNEDNRITSLERIVRDNGESELYLDGELVVVTENTNYDFFLGLIGSEYTFDFDNGLVSPAYQTYGCGRENYIHQFVNSETYTLYTSDINDYTELAARLASYFGLPIASGIATVANYLLSLKEAHSSTDAMRVNLRNYMLKEVGTNAFVMNCHHYMITEYEDVDGELELRQSYMKYGVS